MTRRVALSRLAGAVRRLPVVGRWRADVRGATLVQFVAILPVFVLVVFGMWALFVVYSAQQTLCEAVWEASRYLQVEGPLLPDDAIYPDDWEAMALQIVNEELVSNRLTQIGPVQPDDLEITPQAQRRSPQDMREVTRDEVDNNWFFLHVRATITNPLGLWISGAGEGNQLVLQCKGVGFYEGPPIGPTPGPGSVNRPVKCPPAPICTPGPEPTRCAACTPTPTPECPPCRPR